MGDDKANKGSAPQRDPVADRSLREVDPELSAVLEREAVRQRDHIELIASENYAYAAVREAQGSILTNKYAEGYPGKRYYAGCEEVDTVEDLARTRALQLFPGANTSTCSHTLVLPPTLQHSPC